MSAIEPVKTAHPLGEPIGDPEHFPPPRRVETFGGPVQVKWEEDNGVSLHGPLTYFVEFLLETGLWQKLLDECPLTYSSPNAPTKEEILGTILFSVLSGHRRYAHITAIRSDGVLPGLLGIKQFRSEDSVRRAFQNQDEFALTAWIDNQMAATFEALMDQPWILDVDATVKTLYGKQEEARVGYNPHKPGRPSHVYHAMLLTAARLVLNVDVHAGNQTASTYAQPTVWEWLKARDRKYWPTLLRGDIAYGTEEMMAGAEQLGVQYLFRLRQSKRVAELVAKLARKESDTNWRDAGQVVEAVEAELQLHGWSRKRRVVVQRKRVAQPEADAKQTTGQLTLPGTLIERVDGVWYEYGVLVTNWQQAELLSITQVYRDRGDSENVFDELKNQWGWTGFATADLMRSQLMARIVALIFNWWSIFTRMATGGKHGEAITTRPLLQHGVARRTRHANQERIAIGSVHAKAKKAAHLLTRISAWLQQLKTDAEQLCRVTSWPEILRRIFRDFAGFAFGQPRVIPLDVASNCRT